MTDALAVDVPIPSSAPSGEALFGWTWFNNAGETSSDVGKDLPESALVSLVWSASVKGKPGRDGEESSSGSSLSALPATTLISSASFPVMTGNREMYMNCAVVTVSGGGSGLDGPAPFVANAGVNQCATIEGVDTVFPCVSPFFCR